MKLKTGHRQEPGDVRFQLLDNLVGAREQRRRQFKAKRLGGVKIDDQIKLGGAALPGYRRASFHAESCPRTQQRFGQAADRPADIPGEDQFGVPDRWQAVIDQQVGDPP